MALETAIAGGYPKIGDTAEEQKLRRALHQYDKSEIAEEELEAVINQVTEEVVREQIDAGMDLVTDGLIRWNDPLTYHARKMVGYELKGLMRYFDTNTFYREPVVATRVEYSKPLAVSDYQFAASHSQRPVRAIFTGPYTLAKLSRNDFYRDFKQLAYDLAYIIHNEALELEAAGCQHIQFDEPALLHHKDDIQFFFKIYEIVLAQLSKSEKTLLFNFGSIDGIYPKILGLGVDQIGLDLTQGHQNWEVIRQAPFTKKLMAGIVDARNTKMESEAELTEMIRELEKMVPLDNLRLSTNYSLEYLPRGNARKKMELLASVAKQFKSKPSVAAHVETKASPVIASLPAQQIGEAKQSACQEQPPPANLVSGETLQSSEFGIASAPSDALPRNDEQTGEK
jgi:5-methyltetrahydropteroyltriglutamate--homocysteine methyltransferase